MMTRESQKSNPTPVHDFLAFERRLEPVEAARLEQLRSALSAIDDAVIDRAWSDAAFPRDLVSVLADAGCLRVHLDSILAPDEPESSYLLRGLLTAELARKDASLATFAGVSGSLFSLTLLHFGSAEQRALLPAIASGDFVGAFGLTEPDSGSDVAGGAATTARRDGDGWVLNGAKRWIGNATWCDRIVIWAKEDPGEGDARPRFLGFVVDPSTPGLRIAKIDDKYSLRSVQNAEISLVDVRVPDAARLPGVTSFREIAEVLKFTRVEVGWAAAGNALGALEAATEYAKARRQFGQPIAGFQLVQDLLVRAQTAVLGAYGVLAQAAWLEDRGELVDAHASVVKLMAAHNARIAVAACREVLGGNGILLGNRVMRRFMDAEAILTFEGTHQMNTLITGKAMTGVSAFV